MHNETRFCLGLWAFERDIAEAICWKPALNYLTKLCVPRQVISILSAPARSKLFCLEQLHHVPKATYVVTQVVNTREQLGIPRPLIVLVSLTNIWKRKTCGNHRGPFTPWTTTVLTSLTPLRSIRLRSKEAHVRYDVMPAHDASTYGTSRYADWHLQTQAQGLEASSSWARAGPNHWTIQAQHTEYLYKAFACENMNMKMVILATYYTSVGSEEPHVLMYSFMWFAEGTTEGWSSDRCENTCLCSKALARSSDDEPLAVKISALSGKNGNHYALCSLMFNITTPPWCVKTTRKSNKLHKFRVQAATSSFRPVPFKEAARCNCSTKSIGDSSLASTLGRHSRCAGLLTTLGPGLHGAGRGTSYRRHRMMSGSLLSFFDSIQ